MNKIDKEAAKLAALPLDELEALAAPVMAALRTKRETRTKEERRLRRIEHDRLRRARTVAVTFRFDDAESAAAVRSLVTQLRAVAKKSGRSVASVVAVATTRMPVGRQKANGKPQKGKTKNTTPKNKSVVGVKNGETKITSADSNNTVNLSNGKTDAQPTNSNDGGSVNE